MDPKTPDTPTATTPAENPEPAPPSRNPIAEGLADAVRSAQAEDLAPGLPLTESAIIDAVKTVYDPEIPVNIYDIGLIYNIDLQPQGKVHIQMTLTAPGCPAAQEIPRAVKERVEMVSGVRECEVEIVWDPVWNPSMMSEAARLQLGFF